MKRIVVIGICLLLSCSAAMARTRPFQISLTPRIALYPRDVRIRGLSLNIWGENPQQALALGVVSGSTGESLGFSWSWLLNYSDNYTGVQWAWVNYNRGDYLGWQSGVFNYSDNHFRGVQTGWVNFARELEGIQLGLVNFAERASNTIIQLGLVNVIKENTVWFRDMPNSVAPGMVFFNWRF